MHLKAVLLVVSCLSFFSIVTPMEARATSPAVPAAFDGGSTGCKALGAAVAAGSIHPIVRGARFASARMFEAAAATVGSEALSQPCEDATDRLIEHYSDWGPEDVDYDDFIATHCGGNPLACGGGWSTMGPDVCGSFIVCIGGVTPANSGFGSLSVNDLSGLIGAVDYSHSLGFWVLHGGGGSTPPGGDLDLR